MTGRIYIYPSEWGDSYTSIEGQYQPICIEVQYRNGSKSNPYLLESAEDIAGINANDITLRSHYEIGSVIDMSSMKNFIPIGVLQEDGKNVLKGFCYRNKFSSGNNEYRCFSKQFQCDC